MALVKAEKRGRDWGSAFRNPVAVKELRGRMRGRRAFVLLTIYLIVMSGLILVIYGAIAAAGSGPASPDFRQMGKYVFAAVVGVQLLLVLFVGPSLTAGAISGEKERKTFELLRTTLLSSRRFVVGKLLSALGYVFLLVLASVPLQSISFLLGGISPSEIFISQLLIAVAAVAYAMIGLFISSIARSTVTSSVATYGVVIALTIGIPILAAISTIAVNSFRYGPIGMSSFGEVVYTFLLLFMAAVNLPASILVSEIFLLEHGSLFGYRDMIGGYRVFIFSPWYFSLILYGALAVLLLFLTIRRIKKVARS